MTTLETLVGPVGYALLAGIGAGALIVAIVRGAWASMSNLRKAQSGAPFFIAGLAFGVMLGFWVGVLV